MLNPPARLYAYLLTQQRIPHATLVPASKGVVNPIVILDEATAFTDPENEAAIQASISGLVAGKTLIIIAHHLSTIVGADKIVVMDHGRVSAEGTHHELLESSSLYRSLWNAQQEATHAGGDAA